MTKHELTKHEKKDSAEEMRKIVKFLRKNGGSRKQIQTYLELIANCEQRENPIRRCGGLV